MKRIIAAVTVITVLGVTGYAAPNTVSPAQAGSKAALKAAVRDTRTFKIDNMTCPLCPVTVSQAMQKVKGVKSVKIDFEARTATVIYDPSITTSDTIANASANAGYPAKLIANGS
jgi:mercuric ion binding protein